MISLLLAAATKPNLPSSTTLTYVLDILLILVAATTLWKTFHNTDKKSQEIWEHRIMTFFKNFQQKVSTDTAAVAAQVTAQGAVIDEVKTLAEQTAASVSGVKEDVENTTLRLEAHIDRTHPFTRRRKKPVTGEIDISSEIPDLPTQ